MELQDLALHMISATYAGYARRALRECEPRVRPMASEVAHLAQCCKVLGHSQDYARHYALSYLEDMGWVR